MSKVRSITALPLPAAVPQLRDWPAVAEHGIAERQARVAKNNLPLERIELLRAGIARARRRARRLRLAGVIAWMVLAAGALWSAGVWLLVALGVLR